VTVGDCGKNEQVGWITRVYDGMKLGAAVIDGSRWTARRLETETDEGFCTNARMRQTGYRGEVAKNVIMGLLVQKRRKRISTI